MTLRKRQGVNTASCTHLPPLPCPSQAAPEASSAAHTCLLFQHFVSPASPPANKQAAPSQPCSSRQLALPCSPQIPDGTALYCSWHCSAHPKFQPELPCSPQIPAGTALLTPYCSWHCSARPKFQLALPYSPQIAAGIPTGTPGYVQYSAHSWQSTAPVLSHSPCPVTIPVLSHSPCPVSPSPVTQSLPCPVTQSLSCHRAPVLSVPVLSHNSCPVTQFMPCHTAPGVSPQLHRDTQHVPRASALSSHKAEGSQFPELAKRQSCISPHARGAQSCQLRWEHSCAAVTQRGGAQSPAGAPLYLESCQVGHSLCQGPHPAVPPVHVQPRLHLHQLLIASSMVPGKGEKKDLGRDEHRFMVTGSAAVIISDPPLCQGLSFPIPKDRP